MTSYFLEMNCVLVLFFCAATLAFPQSKGELKFIYALGGLFSIYGEHILKPIYPQLSWDKIFSIFSWVYK